MSVFRWGDTDQAGVISPHTVGVDPQEYVFAVNVPRSTPNQREARATCLGPTEKVQSAYPGWEFQIISDLNEIQHRQGNAGSEQVERGKVGPEVARWVLLAVLVLMLAEVVMAWYFSHHTSLAGTAAATPEARGRLLPVCIAAAAIALVGAVAAVLFHAVQTGDFLGFLPDAFRSWVEACLGIPPAAPGEGHALAPGIRVVPARQCQ